MGRVLRRCSHRIHGRNGSAPLNRRIQVLLSTHEGERYLRPLLDSVLGQDHANLDILVRDDGSSDGTRATLDDYAAGGRVSVVLGENIGVVRSFFELLRIASPEADYVALCDQDDVWLPDKMSRALGFLAGAASGTPLLYASRLQVVDERLSPIEMSPKPRRPLVLGNALVENLLPGCTMVLNR